MKIFKLSALLLSVAVGSCSKEEVINLPITNEIEGVVEVIEEPKDCNYTTISYSNTSYSNLEIDPFFNYFANTEFSSEDMTIFASIVKNNNVQEKVIKVISNHLDEEKGYIQITDLNNNQLYSFRSPQNFTRELLTVDIDNNGYEDVVLIGSGIDTHPYSGDINYIIYNFEDSYELTQLDPEVGCFHGGAAGDVNNDGWIDILPIRRNVNNGVSYLYLNNKDKTFTKVEFGDWQLFQNTLIYELFDIDRDGYLDLVIGGKEYNQDDTEGFYPGHTRVSFGTSEGIDVNNYTILPANDKHSLVTNFNFYDFDNDGQVEIIISRTGPPGPDFYSTQAMQIIKYDDEFEEVTLIEAPEGIGWSFNTYITDVDGDCLADIVPWDPLTNDYKRVYNPNYDNNNGFYYKANTNLEFIPSIK